MIEFRNEKTEGNSNAWDCNKNKILQQATTTNVIHHGYNVLYLHRHMHRLALDWYRLGGCPFYV